MAPKNGAAIRLSRDEWLERALDILATEGQTKLRVEAVCKALGVTKGSFYWHFKDRDDFVRSIVLFWSHRFTEPVIQEVADMGGGARERVHKLLRVVSEKGLARYDISVRAWAAQEPDLVALMVKDVDERRLSFVGSLFSELGFDGQETDMRARATIAYLTYEALNLAETSDQDRSRMLNRFFELITSQ
jgi:AcrR family transcriptional regulator